MAMKKTPMRMCTACREMRPKAQLVRIVKTPQGEIVTDPTGKRNGRGAYLCRSAECLKRAQKINALGRALETQIPPEVYERLGEELNRLDE